MPTTTPAAAPAARTCRFGPLEIDYDERVLEPRAWTLAQSEWAAELARRTRGPLLELCAGAGHIGLAAAVAADRDLVQVEIDPVAAEFARRNAARAGWGARADIRVAPMTGAVHVGETFAVVVADPPYLPTAQVARWPQDPVRAIDGGPDGLALVRACLDVAAAHLAPGGSLLLQVAGPVQAGRVGRLLADDPGSVLHASEVRVTDEERAVLLVERLPAR